ncbi:MAG: hypothetical protein JSS11_02470 [Verrucomicrobia bacterium]|nr:hypothetical protein [Verrucomicrobiota bacterium]
MAADVEKLPFTPNPTEYTFKASVETVAEAVSLIPKKSTRFADFFVANLPTTDGAKKILSLAKALGKVNSHDVYYYRSKPADYLALFDISLYETPAGSTRVTISTIGPRISVPGHGFNLHSFRFDQDRSIPVQPTTVEEYEILLLIGAIVGEKGMPPLSVPEDQKR